MQLRVLRHLGRRNLEREDARASLIEIVEDDRTLGVAGVRYTGAAKVVAARGVHGGGLMRKVVERASWGNLRAAADVAQTIAAKKAPKRPTPHIDLGSDSEETRESLTVGPQAAEVALAAD